MEIRSEYTNRDRQIAKILKLYYTENLNQAQIAVKLGLSVAKVNRLLKIARQSGMVEVNIRLPFANLFRLEEQIRLLAGIDEVIVTPSMPDTQPDEMQFLAQAAASHLISRLKPGDTICLGGGKTLSEVIRYLEPPKATGTRIVPAIGGVPRMIEGDVNSLATRLANKLGGESVSFFAPAFANSEAERDTILGLMHVIRSLELARSARIALLGIGNLKMDASIIRFCPLPFHKLARLVEQNQGVGEVLAYIINSQGQNCVAELSNLLIGISLEDVRSIPIRIGVAGGESKALAIAAAIKGKYFTTLIMDENAAKPLIEILAQDKSQPAPLL
jgi:DNA-binding transcriptional regulator LsrR (DeoR family)